MENLEKISIELKRYINGKRAKFIAQGIGDKVPFDKIGAILNTPQEQPYSIISFNTVDMLRTMEDGEVSHCGLKGIKAFMSDKGFVLVAPVGQGNKYNGISILIRYIKRRVG